MRDIRAKLARYRASGGREGLSPRDLAQAYFLSTEYVRKLERRETWAWLEDKAVPQADLAAEAAASAAKVKKMLDEELS